MSIRPVLRSAFLSVLAACGVVGATQAAAPARVDDVRLWSGPEGTRLVLDLSAPVRHEVFTLENPDRIVIDLRNARLAMHKSLPDGQGPVRSVRSGPQDDGDLRIVLDLASHQVVKSFMVPPDGDAITSLQALLREGLQFVILNVPAETLLQMADAARDRHLPPFSDQPPRSHAARTRDPGAGPHRARLDALSRHQRDPLDDAGSTVRVERAIGELFGT